MLLYMLNSESTSCFRLGLSDRRFTDAQWRELIGAIGKNRKAWVNGYIRQDIPHPFQV